MLLSELLTESSEHYSTYQDWQTSCRTIAPTVMFTGDEKLGSQAFDTMSAGNPMIGEWDGKSRTGTVDVGLKTRRKEFEK